jgi:hypothetical protein
MPRHTYNAIDKSETGDIKEGYISDEARKIARNAIIKTVVR